MKLTSKPRFTRRLPCCIADGMFMKPFLPVAATALLSLTACSSEPEVSATTTNQADEFAARINGDKVPGATADAALAAPAPAALPAPTVAQPLDGITNAPFAAGTTSDPNSACNANTFGEFLGREPSAEVRAAILEAANNTTEVRFIAPGGEYIKPDPTNPRLNVMIAVDGVIRDIRCG
ncbi:MAG: hypothetical protein AAF291_17010 [Pseudomonadota bacterium]